MFVTVACYLRTGHVRRKRFPTWSAARQYADALSERSGRRARVWVERAAAGSQSAPASSEVLR